VSSDFHATLIELIDALAAGDPRRRRFGARSHDWRRRPALGAERVARREAELTARAGHDVRLPDDYRGYLIEVADGGAGPFHGVLPFDHPSQLALAGAGPWRRDAPGQGAIALADLGCDQTALLVIDGPDRGTVWADARAVGAGVVPLAASFTDFFAGGLAAAARNERPPVLAPTESCAIPRLLSALLAREEDRLGRAPGTLAGAELRAALAELGPGSIAIASVGTVNHDRGDPIAPCVQCAILVENLAVEGLHPAAICDAVPPRPLR
jgi:hypothetical protein